MDKKRIYLAKIKNKLKEANAKIYQLKAKCEKVNLEEGIEYHKQIEKVKAMRDLLRLELQELKEIEEDPAGNLEKRIQNSMNDLEETLDIALSKLK